MKTEHKILSAVFLVISVCNSDAQDSLAFRGQLSSFAHLNPENDLPLWSGVRYIPQVNYKLDLQRERFFDIETSLNIYGNAGFSPFDTANFNGRLKPYRLWARFSTTQLEIRAGLQKINFGSASILRPLMWFDQIDPRDPLKLTDGVWGILARYYFLNNINIWAWGLYGNENLKGWESVATGRNKPEFGGRFQTPLPRGEAGLSYHHRTADGSSMSDPFITGNIIENRLGLDAKFDMTIGWWIEASWSQFSKDIGDLTSQGIFNLGLDYTFGLGNGLTVIYEQLAASTGNEPFRFDNVITFSLLSVTYPLGMFDNLSTILYYDLNNSKLYSFLTWQRQFNKLSLYLMGYVNPKEYNIPARGKNGTPYAGSGLQVMLVINH